MRKIRRQDKLFKCGECGFLYSEEEWARKCEEWCSKHNSCNIMITKHAVIKGTE